MVESKFENIAPLTDITEIKKTLKAKPKLPVILIFGGVGTGKSTLVSNLTGIQAEVSN